MRIRSIHQSLHVDKAVCPSGKIEFQPLEDDGTGVQLFEGEIPTEVGEYLLKLDSIAGKDREGQPCPKGDFIEIAADAPAGKIKRASITMMLHPDEQELIEFFRAMAEEEREDMMDGLRRERERRRTLRDERRAHRDGPQSEQTGNGENGQGLSETLTPGEHDSQAGKGKKKAQG